MKVIYEADDGTRFTNAVDCEDYEWKLKHSTINKIKFYNSNDKELLIFSMMLHTKMQIK